MVSQSIERRFFCVVTSYCTKGALEEALKPGGMVHNHSYVLIKLREDPEQEYEERRRQIARQKLGPRQERQALKQSDACLESLRNDANDDTDPVPALKDLAPRVGNKFKFVFDFGDWWEHTVRVEKVQPVVPGQVYPRCLAGAGANPLEDCGGPWRLMAIYNAVKNPGQPRDETIQHTVKNWVGEDWDFTRFSVEETNQQIRKMFRSVPPPSEG